MQHDESSHKKVQHEKIKHECNMKGVKKKERQRQMKGEKIAIY